nr:DDB1- and CUL4-associated factor 1-like [Mirounga angustirostris]
MSELIEKETEEYRKGDPDPFDDRHPGRADPECMLGHLLRILFKNDDFMNALVNAYVMTSREPPLNTAACRLLLDIMPGLETAVVFQEKVFTKKKSHHFIFKLNVDLFDLSLLKYRFL